MSSAVPPIVLVDLNALVAFGRQDKFGNPDRIIVPDPALKLLQELEKHRKHPDLAVVRFNTRTTALRRWIAKSKLASILKPSFVFGDAGTHEETLKKLTAHFGVGSAQGTRKGIYVGNKADRDIALKLGWLVTEGVCHALTKLNNGRFALLRVPRPQGMNANLSVKSLFAPFHSFTPPLILEDTWEEIVGLVGGKEPVLETTTDREARALLDGSMELVDDVVGCAFYSITHSDDLTKEELEQLQTELRAHRFCRPSGQRSHFLVVAPGAEPVIPHPVRAPHGHTLELHLPCWAYPDPPQPPRLDEKELTEAEIRVLSAIDCCRLKSVLEKLCGQKPLRNHTSISSRDMEHVGNAQAMVFTARWLQRVLREHTVYHRTGSFRKFEICNIDGRIPGSDPDEGIVVLGAHLDSVDKCAHPDFPKGAPGADDDGSGVAAVLLAAKFLAELSEIEPPRREIRFVLFNDEENGMQGSQDYIRTVVHESQDRDLNTKIAAMIQLDMIGWRGAFYDAQGLRPGVVRGPGTDSPLYAASEAICTVLEKAAKAMKLERWLSSVPPVNRDPMAARSDHGSFYAKGFPACLVTERGIELTTGGCSAWSSNDQWNTNYHSNSDVDIDYQMASSLARIAAGAAWMIAKS